MSLITTMEKPFCILILSVDMYCKQNTYKKIGPLSNEISAMLTV